MKETVEPTRSINGELSLPPDKSIAHRSGLFSLLSSETSVIRNYSKAADPQTTLDAIQLLGANIEEKNDALHITGVGRDGFPQAISEIDCENSGTTIRLLSGIVAGAQVDTKLTGDQSLSKRPMRRILTPLEHMGASIQAEDDTYPPLLFQGPHKSLSSIRYELPVASAQVKSCVLLAGLFTEGNTEVVETVQSRDHTERMLNLPKQQDGDKTIITSNREHPLDPLDLEIPGDFSAAAFWIVAALIVPDSSLTLRNVGLNPTRTALLDIVRQMGADIEIERVSEDPEPIGHLHINYSDLKPIEIEESQIPNCIDELPILSVLFSFVDGVSSFRGAKELRFKESDRIDAICKMLSGMGVTFTEFEDGLEIEGNADYSFPAATFESHHDHRIAMASAIASLRASGSCKIQDAECASISYPDFWRDLKNLTG